MKKGFTLIEILLVVLIMAILSVSVVPNVGKYADINTLNQTAQNISANIELVKFKALSGAYSNGNRANWAVTFCPGGDTSKYKMYALVDNGGGSVIEEDVREIDLDNNVTFDSSCATGDGVVVIFDRLTSRPEDTVTKSVDLLKNGYQIKLTVDGVTGKVGVTKIK